jgi:hypothetical protein
VHRSWNGYQSGIAAEFLLDTVLDLFYQGSVFSDAGSAASYMRDSYTELTSGPTDSTRDCSDVVGYPCKVVGYTTTEKKLAVYYVTQIENCAIEVGAQGKPDTMYKNSDDVANAASDIFMQGVAAAKAACASSSAPHPTQVPATPRPTGAPSPAPLPTGSSTSGNGSSASGLIFRKRGAGSYVTPAFSAPASWRVDWWYNCSYTHRNGHYTLKAMNTGGVLEPGVKRFGWEQHGSLQFQRGGHVFLRITTACHWHLRAYAQ